MNRKTEKNEIPLHEIETKCTTCHRRLELNGEIFISEYRRCENCHLRTCIDCAYILSSIEWLCAKPRCHILYESRCGEKIGKISSGMNPESNVRGLTDEEHPHPSQANINSRHDLSNVPIALTQRAYTMQTIRPNLDTVCQSPTTKKSTHGVPLNPIRHASSLRLQSNGIDHCCISSEPNSNCTQKEAYQIRQQPRACQTFRDGQDIYDAQSYRNTGVKPKQYNPTIRALPGAYSSPQQNEAEQMPRNDYPQMRSCRPTTSHNNCEAPAHIPKETMEYLGIGSNYSIAEYFIEHCHFGIPGQRQIPGETSLECPSNARNNYPFEYYRKKCQQNELDHRRNSREKPVQCRPNFIKSSPSKCQEQDQSNELEQRKVVSEKTLEYDPKEYGHTERTLERRKDSREKTLEQRKDSREKILERRKDSREKTLEQRKDSREKTLEYDANEIKQSPDEQHQERNQSNESERRIRKKPIEHHPSERKSSLAQYYKVQNQSEPERRQFSKERTIEYHPNELTCPAKNLQERGQSAELEQRKIPKGKPIEHHSNERRPSSSQHHMDQSRQCELERRRKPKDRSIEYNPSEIKSNPTKYDQEPRQSDELVRRNITRERSGECNPNYYGLTTSHKELSKSSELHRRQHSRERLKDNHKSEIDLKSAKYHQQRSHSVQMESRNIVRGKSTDHHTDEHRLTEVHRELSKSSELERTQISRERSIDHHHSEIETNPPKYSYHQERNPSGGSEPLNISRRSTGYHPSERLYTQSEKYNKEQNPPNNLEQRSWRERAMEYSEKRLWDSYYIDQAEADERKGMRTDYCRSSINAEAPRRELPRPSEPHPRQSYHLSEPRSTNRQYSGDDMLSDDEEYQTRLTGMQRQKTYVEDRQTPYPASYQGRQDNYTSDEYTEYHRAMRSRSPTRRASYDASRASVRQHRQHSIDNSDVYVRPHDQSLGVRDQRRHSRPQVPRPLEPEIYIHPKSRSSRSLSSGRGEIMCRQFYPIQSPELSRKHHDYPHTRADARFTSSHQMPKDYIESRSVHHRRPAYRSTSSDSEDDFFESRRNLPRGCRSSLGYLAVRIQRNRNSILFTLAGAHGLRHRNQPISRSVYPRAYAIGCSPPYESNNAHDSPILESTEPNWESKWLLPLPDDELNGTIFDIFVWDVEFVNKQKDLIGVASVEVKESNYCDKIQWLPILKSFTDGIDRSSSKSISVANINGTFIALHLHDMQMRLESRLVRGTGDLPKPQTE